MNLDRLKLDLVIAGARQEVETTVFKYNKWIVKTFLESKEFSFQIKQYIRQLWREDLLNKAADDIYLITTCNIDDDKDIFLYPTRYFR